MLSSRPCSFALALLQLLLVAPLPPADAFVPQQQDAMTRTSFLEMTSKLSDLPRGINPFEK